MKVLIDGISNLAKTGSSIEDRFEALRLEKIKTNEAIRSKIEELTGKKTRVEGSINSNSLVVGTKEYSYKTALSVIEDWTNSRQSLGVNVRNSINQIMINRNGRQESINVTTKWDSEKDILTIYASNEELLTINLKTARTEIIKMSITVATMLVKISPFLAAL